MYYSLISVLLKDMLSRCVRIKQHSANSIILLDGKAELILDPLLNNFEVFEI